jgi:uncharacterized repeat protein (TIGR01451 family)
MKKNPTNYLCIVPLAGMLALTACSTTSEQKPQPATATTAPPAPAMQEAGMSASYLVQLFKKGPATVSVGDNFSYVITAQARTDVAETTIMDTLPAGASYVSSDPAAAQEGNKLTWKLGNMNKGETKTIMVTLKADKEGELANCATVSAIPRVCVTTIVGKPQLALQKTGPASAQVGQNVTYTVSLRNTGNSVAKSVVVTDPIPEGFSSATAQGKFSFDVGDMPPGASRSVQVTLHADKRGKFCNKVFASSSNAGKVEAEVCTTVIQPSLKVEKKTSNAELFINQAAAYDILVSNTGDTDLSGIMVTDNAAPETVIAAANDASVMGSTATWNVGALKAGEKKTLSVKVISKVPGKFCDTVTATSAEGLRDSSQACTIWKGVTGVLLETIDDPDPIQVGETSRFTIRVTNQGSTIDIKDLNIVATLPPEVDVLPGTVSDGGTISGKEIAWPAIGSVAPKASVTRTYIVKGVKAGDARTKVSITTSMRKDPIEKVESTTVY